METNKTFYSQMVWIGYNIELAELVYLFRTTGRGFSRALSMPFILLNRKNKHSQTWVSKKLFWIKKLWDIFGTKLHIA